MTWRDRWPSLAAVVSTYPPEECGVYFLVRDNEIVYIGSSEYPSKRVFGHHQDSRKKFSESYFLAVDKVRLLETERHWIRTICPVHNKQFNPKQNDDFEGWGIDPDYFFIRLPTEYWCLLKEICKAEKRTMTAAAQFALDDRAKKLGVKADVS